MRHFRALENRVAPFMTTTMSLSFGRTPAAPSALRVVPQNIPAAHEPDALRLAVVVLRHERPQLPDGARLRDLAPEVARGKGLAAVRPERDLEGRRRRRLRRALALEEGADRVAEAQAAAERAVDEALRRRSALVARSTPVKATNSS